MSTLRRRISGAAGIPTLSPPLQAGEIVTNEDDADGLIAQYGAGNDGNGNAISAIEIGGPGIRDLLSCLDRE